MGMNRAYHQNTSNWRPTSERWPRKEKKRGEKHGMPKQDKNKQNTGTSPPDNVTELVSIEPNPSPSREYKAGVGGDAPGPALDLDDQPRGGAVPEFELLDREALKTGIKPEAGDVT